MVRWLYGLGPMFAPWPATPGSWRLGVPEASGVGSAGCRRARAGKLGRAVGKVPREPERFNCVPATKPFPFPSPFLTARRPLEVEVSGDSCLGSDQGNPSRKETSEPSEA